MKKRITLSDEQLERVADLRARSVPWSRIGAELGVHRLIVKREYLAWERVQGPAKLSEVRREVAMEDYRRHVEQLTAVAAALDRTIGWVLTKPPWLTKDDPLSAGIEASAGLPVVGDDPFRDHEEERRQRVWSLLYGGLLRHLGGGEWRETREEWDQKRRRCAEVYADWHQELVREVRCVEEAIPHSVQDVSAEGLARAMEDVAWSTLLSLIAVPIGNTGITEDQWPDIVEPAIRSLKAAVKVDRLDASEWTVLVRDRPALVGIESGQVAESVSQACRNLLWKMLATDQSRFALVALHRLREAGERLAQHLEPLRLRPVLLRTRCEFCPA